MADIMTVAKDELRGRGRADAAALAARAVSGEADGTELTASQEQIPTWRQRDFSAVTEWCTSCGSSTTPPSSRTGLRIRR